MLVSLRWLARYFDTPLPPTDELAHRLAMSGLNHEETIEFDGDVILDLEVTSNRGDCLGHLGVAREVSALYETPMTTPEVSIEESGDSIESSLSVENRFVDACPRYTARLVRGVTVGASPDWMVDALRSAMVRRVGGKIETYKPINNVVDASNYVLLECGQPLHAFDYSKLKGGRIVVRPAADGETMTAIDHREYTLSPDDCVIADASRPAAVAGVMGGADTEVDEATRDVVIESAVFTPLSIRRTARRLKLHSPSSFRFERRVDPVGVDWAGRRLCELIVQTGGGTVAPGVIDTAPEIPRRDPIRWKVSDVLRVLGIEVPPATAIDILRRLGCESQSDGGSVTTTPPSWRHDLTRGADLIEEIARVHGYDKIPEDAPIAVAPSRRRVQDDATDRIRRVLTAAGLSEAMTPSVVTAALDGVASPWTDRAALQTQTPMLKGARTLRRSLIPSLLQSRARNQAAASIDAELFEIAHLYLPGEDSPDSEGSRDGDALPVERYAVGFVVGDDFRRAKGIVEALLHHLGVRSPLAVTPESVDGMSPGRGVALHVGDRPLGYLGCIDPKRVKPLKLSGGAVAAELSLEALMAVADLTPQQRPIPTRPSVTRDLNFIVDEAVRWSDLETAARETIGETLADLRYVETYRDEKADGPDRKRVLMAVELRKDDATLSGDDASGLVDGFVDAVRQRHNGKLVG